MLRKRKPKRKPAAGKPVGLFLKYFVLKPKGDDSHAWASRQAMRTYAQSIRGVNFALSEELNAWADYETKAVAKGLKP